MPGLAAAGGMAIPCLADASSLRRGGTSLWLVRSDVPAFFLFLPVCRNAASGSIRSPRAGGNWLSRGVARGVIHVFAGGPGRTLYKAALDLDQFVDLHVCILETPASLAQMPSPAGCADQVQPAPFKETERSPSDALVRTHGRALVQGSGPGAQLHGVLLTDLIPVKIRTTSRRELNFPKVL